MLLELIIFAFVLVALQTGMTLLIWVIFKKYCMSAEFIKKYTKMIINVTEELCEEMDL